MQGSEKTAPAGAVRPTTRVLGETRDGPQQSWGRAAMPDPHQLPVKLPWRTNNHARPRMTASKPVFLRGDGHGVVIGIAPGGGLWYQGSVGVFAPRCQP
ncbi:hypothetical protein [Saccharopolyspora phatthalungensis]|uniref:Uncharacterized protein n=1 Tax=Saccharopolyspora phatthalungensis TaxID=664693 RepID=A0A840QFG1_9PSEU|nr:hypothetical protein [Saccharopolyspora phatthalungensis]MBB5158660.1 hypothetical protein [Saccharopolyspora phatthalungensis]